MLKQEGGEYSWNSRSYEAKKILNVTNQEAYYLVNDAKAAILVDEKGSPIESPASQEKHSKTPINPLRPPNPDDIKIAMIRLGGMGDSLILAIQARAVRRKYPKSYIVAFIRDRLGAEVLNIIGSVDHVIISGDKNWAGTLDSIKDRDFHIIYDNRYGTKVYYINSSQFKKDKEETDKAFAPWEKYYHNFPFNCNKLTTENPNLSEWELIYKSCCLKRKEEDFSLKLESKDMAMANLLEGEKYVTIHNGADLARQTKCWHTDYWNEVSKYLKDQGYKVIQLGVLLEEKVEGAVDMLGKCTIRQTIGLITKAEFHIDTEGGLAHLARMVGTRSIVLFSPTPVSFFGYKENVNIETPFECKGCWWTTDFWWRECPKGYENPPPCMRQLTPDLVIKAIDNMPELGRIKDPEPTDEFYDNWAIEMPLNEGHYKAEPWQWDRVYTMMEMVRGKNVLEVGAGDGYCASVLKSRGHQVTATEISQVRLKRMLAAGIDAHYADINDLPFPDASFDTVICGEVLEHIESPGKGLAELERVCKPDGKIIISLPVSKAHWEFKGHLWGLEHHSILREGKLDMIVMSMERINR